MTWEALEPGADRPERNGALLRWLSYDRGDSLGVHPGKRRDCADGARRQATRDQELRADEHVEAVEEIGLKGVERRIRDLEPGEVRGVVAEPAQHLEIERIARGRGELVDVERERLAGSGRGNEMSALRLGIELEVRGPDHRDRVGACFGSMRSQLDGLGGRLGTAMGGDEKPVVRGGAEELEAALALGDIEQHRLSVRPEREHPVEPTGDEKIDVRADRGFVDRDTTRGERRQRRRDSSAKSFHQASLFIVRKHRVCTVGALRIERDDDVLRIILSRPETRNALDPALIAEALEAFVDVGTVRAVVLRGEGKSFCAGADIEWMRSSADLDHDANVADATAFRRMLEAIDTCPAPVLALVQGHALGGGVGLVACADIAVAHPGAVFAFSEVKLGIIPAMISPFAIRKLGESAVRRYFLTGQRFDAATALRIGLVHEVADDLAAAEARVIAELRSAGPRASRHAKRLVLDRPDGPETARRIAERRTSAEGQAGLKAFLDGERPPWAR